jgi:hypothetical protein
MVVVLVAVQACLWAHASAVVQSAAAEGVQAASDLGGSLQSGEDRARTFLASAAPALVVSPEVQATVTDSGQVEMHVTATAESVLPWFHLSVGALRRSPVQGFRSDR